ncbi:helix-turn-helix transcriptional regulator [Pseudarthrobacter sp. J1738]|uniref:helix-turn-helix transcriptional regulator n=1 Tax=unclassified Pseudarthrobacter TaxID=2647000 RepID=UPI003D26D8FD
MSAAKTERLLKLLIALLSTKYGYTREYLRRKLYAEASSEEAFLRMFERDKSDLRTMGIPIEIIGDAGMQGEESEATKYRIRQDQYRLPDVTFTAQERSVLVLAAQLWEQASLGQAALSAVQKIAGGLPATNTSSEPEEAETASAVLPRIRTAGPAFDAVMTAMRGHYAITFAYRSRGSEDVKQRMVEPWGLGNRFGQWYLVGRDVQVGEQRTFRLSRMASAVTSKPNVNFLPPENFDVTVALDQMEELPAITATVAVAPAKALALRNRALSATESIPSGQRPAAGSQPGATDLVWEELQLEYRDHEVFAEELAALGPNVRVLEPAPLRAATVRRLSMARAASMTKAPSPAAFAGLKAGSVTRRTRSSSEERLKRLLGLVPFLVRNPGMHKRDIAANFGITEQELDADLNIVMCSGLPDGYHNDLMDVQFDDGHVYLENAEELSKPVRFTMEEACALLVGLESLSGLPGLADREALDSATVKLTEAAGDVAALAPAVEARLTPSASPEILERIQKGLGGRRQLRLKYLVPSRDEVTERTVDPLRLISQDDSWYLEAWCHSAEANRNFKLERLLSVEVTEKPIATHSRTDDGFPATLFTAHDTDQVVTLALSDAGAWLAEHYYAEATAPLPDGGLLANIRVASTAWLPSAVAQHGGSLRVVEPASVAAQTLGWLDESVQLYQSEQ